MDKKILKQAKKIKLILTDNDGVLTDAGVYYSESGEELKRFSIRDGMGVARLRDIAGVETGIVTGEISMPVKRRADKLKITELHMGVRDKAKVMKMLLKKKNIKAENIAYIGDDTNDLNIIKNVGLSACPADAMTVVKDKVHYICEHRGGHGAFREFAEIIIRGKNGKSSA
jgi:3-deoxy-D-manno-octulosonate 8-phosphate phosphatase (KDO 8-P phosphatase)